MADEKKFLDQSGVEFLWSKISMDDYPNNDMLIAVLNAIDETKADKNNVLTVPSGATSTFENNFGEGPYTFEFTESSEDNAKARQIEYDPSSSRLTATNVQAAIDEIMRPSGTDYSTYKLRNIAILDTVPTEMNNGDIALVYIKEE